MRDGNKDVSPSQMTVQTKYNIDYDAIDSINHIVKYYGLFIFIEVIGKKVVRE